MTTATSTEPIHPRHGGRTRSLTVCLVPLLAGLLAVSCGDGAMEPEAGSSTEGAADAGGESWSVTAWGEHYEIFPEIDALVAGETATAHTHVTVLDGFQPLAEGTVEIVLRRPAGERTFPAAAPSRSGIFPVEIRPEDPGEADLWFRIRSEAGTEEIRGGRVRIGTAAEPGGLTVAPAPRGPSAGGEPIPFLKEEQWRAAFATHWVRRTTLREAVEGLARVRPAAGGEARITAPVDGLLLSDPWPWPGRPAAQGEPLFRLVPRTGERNLPDLEAQAAGLERELATARARLTRLEELLELEAVPRRDVEELRTRVETLDGRLTAARRTLAATRAVRSGSGADAEAVALGAPFTGEVAAVAASPGAAVAAGEELARLVRTDPLWLDVALAPEAAHRLRSAPGRERALAGAVLSTDGGSETETADRSPGSLELGADRVRLISIAPEIDRATGTVRTLVEVRAEADRDRVGSTGLVIGSTLRAHLLLDEEREGIVVPASALVDDGGVSVVYLQLSGERFARQPVEVVARRGDRVLVEGLVPGQRLVADGGQAVRRSSLLATGQAQGHVH